MQADDERPEVPRFAIPPPPPGGRRQPDKLQTLAASPTKHATASPGDKRSAPSSQPRGQTSPPSSTPTGEPASAPSSHIRQATRAPGPRLPSPMAQVTEALRELFPGELAEVARFIDTLRAARGAAPSPDLISCILAELSRLLPSYRSAVPVSRLRVEFPCIRRRLFDEALLEAERRGMLRLLPVELPAPFVEPSAGVHSSRGLLYLVAPAFG